MTIDLVNLAELAAKDPVARGLLDRERLQRFEREVVEFPHTGTTDEKQLARNHLLADIRYRRIPSGTRSDALRLLEQHGILTVREAEQVLAEKSTEDSEMAWKPEILSAETSEDRLALEFTSRNAEDWRYVAPWGQWYQWNGTSWRAESTLRAYDLARRFLSGVFCSEGRARTKRKC